MKLRIQLFMCYLLMANVVFCQNNISIDSLQQLVFSDKEDTNKVNHLNKLCIEYLIIGSFDTSFRYGNTALKLANELNYPNGMANSYNNTGVYYRYQGNYEKAMENHFTALKIREKINDKQGIAVSYNNLGVVCGLKYNYEKALEYFFIALKTGREINDKQKMAASYNNIGNVYSDHGKLNSHPDSHNVYQNYEKALENYFASLKLKIEIDDKLGMAASYNNIGIIYSSQGNNEKALKYFFLALKIREEISDKQGIASSYINISNSYTAKLNYPDALFWQQKGQHLAKEIGAKDLLMSSYQGLSDISEKMNDYKNAYKYYQLYTLIKDSIFNDESSKQIAEMQTKYETEKKDKEIILLNNENKIKVLEIAEQQQQLFKNKILFATLIVGIILITVISWLLISRNRIRQKEILQTEHLKQQQLRTKAVIETQEQERKRIAQDLHDGIGQTLAAMKMNISSKAKFVSEENQKVLQQIVVSIDSAHKEVRTLSHSMMPKALNESGLENAIDDLLEKILANSTIKCIFEKDSAIRFDENTEIGLYRVFQELINNILKHANASEIAVHLHKTKTQIVLMVEDNGMGIKQKQPGEKKGMGLSNIETRVHALNGTFSISAGTHQGTIAVVRIPTNNNQSITIL